MTPIVLSRTSVGWYTFQYRYQEVFWPGVTKYTRPRRSRLVAVPLVEKYVGREARALVFPIYGASVPDASVPVFLAAVRPFERTSSTTPTSETRINASPFLPRSRRTPPKFRLGVENRVDFAWWGAPPQKNENTEKLGQNSRGRQRPGFRPRNFDEGRDRDHTKPGEKPDGVCVDGKENAPRALGEPTL